MQSNTGLPPTSSGRFIGLDAIRGISAFGIVLLHIYGAAGAPDSLQSLIRLRSFSFPVIVMSSFFVVTLSLIRKPETRFSQFFLKRLQRLWIPLMIWSLIYSIVWAFIMPIILRWNEFKPFEPFETFLTGYRHLWFLQFIFLGSLLIYPVIYLLTRQKAIKKTTITLLLLIAAIVYKIIFDMYLYELFAAKDFLPSASNSFNIFVRQASGYLFYIPFAIIMALNIEKINYIFSISLFRLLSIILAAAAAILHLFNVSPVTDAAPLTKILYSLSVFLVALQPWKKIPFDFMYVLARYSFGTYVLHFIFVEILGEFTAYLKWHLTGLQVIGISIVVYFISLAAAIIINRLIPVDWLLPLVPVGVKPNK